MVLSIESQTDTQLFLLDEINEENKTEQGNVIAHGLAFYNITVLRYFKNCL